MDTRQKAIFDEYHKAQKDEFVKYGTHGWIPHDASAFQKSRICIEKCQENGVPEEFMSEMREFDGAMQARKIHLPTGPEFPGIS